MSFLFWEKYNITQHSKLFVWLCPIKLLVGDRSTLTYIRANIILWSVLKLFFFNLKERLCRRQQTDPVLDPALSVDSLLRHAMTFQRWKKIGSKNSEKKFQRLKSLRGNYLFPVFFQIWKLRSQFFHSKMFCLKKPKDFHSKTFVKSNLMIIHLITW